MWAEGAVVSVKRRRTWHYKEGKSKGLLLVPTLLFLFLGQNEKKGPKKLQEFDLDLHEQTKKKLHEGSLPLVALHTRLLIKPHTEYELLY